MKAKILSIAVLFALSAAAAASPPFVVPPPFQGGGDGGSATAISGASSNATALQGQVQGQVQGQSLTVGGQTTSVTIEAPPAASTLESKTTYGGTYTVKSVPDAYAPSVYPTAPCRISISGAGSGVGFGLSIGGSVLDEDCNRRELSRSFQNLGMNDDALAILCSHEGASAAPSCAAVVPPVATTQPVRPASGFRYDDRTGERVCAYDATLASRNKLTVCP